MIQSIGHYDEGERTFPYYYPQFDSLSKYKGFKCYKHIEYDEDYDSMGDNYYGIMIGDEADFSPAGKLPPVGNLASEGRIGFLILLRR